MKLIAPDNSDAENVLMFPENDSRQYTGVSIYLEKNVVKRHDTE